MRIYYIARFRVRRMWRDIQRAFARRFRCAFWGCKPYGEYGWATSYIGKFDKQKSVQGTCENCGEPIR